MKNLSIAVVVTALIAFSLGYFTRGTVDRTPSVSDDPEKFTVRDQTESPATQAQTIERTNPTEANDLSTEDLDYGAVITTTHSSPRVAFVRTKSDKLGDFFLANNVSAERAGTIIQDLVDADHYISQKTNDLYGRHSIEEAKIIAQGSAVTISGTEEERSEIEAEKETLYRQVFGEYYEAYEEYLRSYPQRSMVSSFSSSLPEPLEYVAKETVVKIMYEELSTLNSPLKSGSSGSGKQQSTAPPEWEVEKEQYYERLQGRRSYNQRVVDRAKAYLTREQFEQLKRHLDNDLRRFELLIEIADLEEAL